MFRMARGETGVISPSSSQSVGLGPQPHVPETWLEMSIFSLPPKGSILPAPTQTPGVGSSTPGRGVRWSHTRCPSASLTQRVSPLRGPRQGRTSQLAVMSLQFLLVCVMDVFIGCRQVILRMLLVVGAIPLLQMYSSQDGWRHAHTALLQPLRTGWFVTAQTWD